MLTINTNPVRHWIEDDWADVSKLPEIPGNWWAGWEACYNNDVERGKRTARDIGMLAGYGALITRLRDCAATWSHRLGYYLSDDPQLHGGGLHVTTPGGFLGTHLDYARHPHYRDKRRALNLILFTHPEWQSEWGGQFYLADTNGHPVVTIEPRPGRLLAFETNDLSYHGVKPVTGPCDRVSLAVYYLADATERDTRTRALFIPNRGGDGS